MRRMIVRSFIFVLTIAASLAAQAAIQLPKNLSHDDRLKILEIVGFGSSSKILSDPYPLGGYAGFEVGFALENLPAEDIGRLGDQLPAPQRDLTISKLTFGKGVYNNFDFFFHFTPHMRPDEVVLYGGMVRWGFYQGSDRPISLSTLIHVNTVNFSNQLTTHTYGIDLVGGVTVESLALFAGIGAIEAGGRFLGGSSGVTDTGAVESEFATGIHTIVGADIRIRNAFIALQIDRYKLPVFSGKLGYRF